MDIALWDTEQALSSLGPRFVSITYGAGGTARERTHATVGRIAREPGIPNAAHLTSIDADRSQILDIARAYWDAGVRHIVVLRGAPPQQSQKYSPHPNGFANAAALTAGLKTVAPFKISVAAYPECHPDSPSILADINNLTAKIDAGANRAITRFFFSHETFFRFRDQAAAAGIDAEIVPGILPVSNVAQTRKFSAMCGAKFRPGWTGSLRASTTIRKRASSSPRQSPRNCAENSMPAQLGISISIH